ncbi:MAG: hypothetical protein WC025_04070 [Candidatus Magasanikbacteria bacterium]
MSKQKTPLLDVLCFAPPFSSFVVCLGLCLLILLFEELAILLELLVENSTSPRIELVHARNERTTHDEKNPTDQSNTCQTTHFFSP